MTVCVEKAVLRWRAQIGTLVLQHHKALTPEAVKAYHGAACLMI